MTAMRTPFSADQKPSFAPRAGKGVIALSGVSKMFGPTLANVDVSLHIARGDVLGLVGGNGAGKSTLMRILCGVFRPDTGTLSVDGTMLALEDFDAKAAQDLGIRIVHQELSLCSNLTVAENFFLEAPQAAYYRPGWREVYRQRARAALDAVFPGNGINVHKKVEGLPIGERQMVEIARAVATPGVRLIILDEPTSSLGLERSRQLRAYIHDKAAAGLSFIFISHKLFEVIDVANAVAVLRNGRLVWHGEARDVVVHDLVTMMGGAVQPVAARREVGATGEAAVRIKGDVATLIGHEVTLRARRDCRRGRAGGQRPEGIAAPALRTGARRRRDAGAHRKAKLRLRRPPEGGPVSALDGARQYRPWPHRAAPVSGAGFGCRRAR